MPANKPPCANRETVEAFARFFDPPLAVVTTEKIGNMAVANGWMCALHLPEHEIGLTAVCWGKGYFKAWIEATGTREDATRIASYLAPLTDSLAGKLSEAIDLNVLAGASPDAETMVKPVKPLQSMPKYDYQPQQFATGGIAAKSPNPEFIDMLGLSPAEQLALIAEYPDLKYIVDHQGKRWRPTDNGNLVDDIGAGYVASDRLEHVRRLNRGRMGGAAAVADAAIERACEHDFRKNSIGDQATCWKCGLAGPKAPHPQPDADADAEHAEYLRKVAAQQAAYDAERAKQRLEGGNGGT